MFVAHLSGLQTFSEQMRPKSSTFIREKVRLLLDPMPTSSFGTIKQLAQFPLKLIITLATLTFSRAWSAMEYRKLSLLMGKFALKTVKLTSLLAAEDFWRHQLSILTFIIIFRSNDIDDNFSATC